MVVFTCNNCGDSLQKPKVAKHYQFACRHNPVDLTCVDCHKDFRGDEYVKHTKCITEDERYGGKGFTLKASANKGERKQQEWINVVQNLLNTSTNLTGAERNILNTLSRHENIPRKKAKFLNFIRSVFGHRVNMPVIESLWTKMEDSFKGSVANNQPQSTNGSSTQNGATDQSREDNAVENQNNENIIKENGDSTEQNENAENQNTANGIEPVKKKKKSKKRSLETPDSQEEELTAKKRLKNDPQEETDVCESQVDKDDSKFLWKNNITEIVTAKGEISLKKLKKKVVDRYLNHCSNSIDSDKAMSKFDKKIKKVSGINIVDEKVTLS